MTKQSYMVLPTSKISSFDCDLRSIGATSEENSDLKTSIQENGILTSILVVANGDGRYKVINGHRRLKIAKLLDIKEIPAVVMENASEVDAIIWQFSDIQTLRSMTDTEQGNALKRAYELEAYSINEILTNLDRIRHHDQGGVKKCPQKFYDMHRRFFMSASHQLKLIQWVTLASPRVQELAEENRLPTMKKMLLIDQGIIREKDPEVREHIQKTLVSKIAATPQKVAQWHKDQEVRNVRQGNVYEKDPETKRIIKNDANEEKIPLSDELKTKVEGYKYIAAITDFEATIHDLLEELTGTIDHNFKEEIVTNSEKYRVDLFKRIRQSDVIRFYNKMFAVKAAVDSTVQILDKELKARNVNEKLLIE